MKKYYNDIFILVIITVISAVLRLRYLPTAPFWVDEYSSANQAMLLIKYGFEIFTQNGHYFEFIKLLPSLFIALSFKLIGISEISARLPSLIIGTLVPPLTYVLFRRNYGISSGLSAGLFSACSYIMITWSQQARGYPLVQLYVLLLFISYGLIAPTPSAKRSLILFSFALAGAVIHPFCLLALLTILVYEVIFSPSKHVRLVLTLFLVVVGALIFAYGYLLQSDLNMILRLSVLDFSNNLSYYHSYLWRTQTITTFLGAIGFILAIRKTKMTTITIGIFVLIYLLFIIFMFGPFVTRYLLPILPMIFGFAGIAVNNLGKLIGVFGQSQRSSIVVASVFTVLIILNGDTFVIKPKPFYNINHEFREIAIIDYNKVYGIAKEKGKFEEGKTAFIDTWADRAEWYLGSQKYIYMFRWTDAGLMKSTAYYKDQSGNKIISQRSGMGLVANLSDLKRVQKKYPKGFIFIDDDTLPRDVIDYAEKNLKKELFLDHYPLDDNPYSKWPATLYSWGID